MPNNKRLHKGLEWMNSKSIVTLIKIFLSFILLICSFSCVKASKDDFTINEMLGCWKVKDYLHGEEAAYTYKQLTTFVRRNYCFSKDTARLFVDTVVKPNYFIKKVLAKDYFEEEYQLPTKYFGITVDSIFVIQITGIGVSSNFSKKYSSVVELFYDGNYLFMMGDGVIFRLYKPHNSINRTSGS